MKLNHDLTSIILTHASSVNNPILLVKNKSNFKMGRNHRHKKDVKAEKAKIKLKQSKTKFLPKGQNVTNPSFKIKPIILPEQLKQKGSDELLSKRKLNVKDLLSRARHYNENIRHAACEELSDMVRIYTEEITQHYLSSVCLVISSLMQDRERKVRKAAAKSIDVILACIPNEKLTPFFDYFSTNLRCAMTNIDKIIQEDSLMFLDCFIKNDCDLITKSSDKLLPDFLSLISKLRSDSQLGRTLTLNLDSKMTSATWRIKVLSRLHAVLNAILEKKDECQLESFVSSDTLCDASSRNTFPIYKSNFAQILEEPVLDIFATNKTVTHNGLETLNRHIITLVPLLYETWLEVMPEQVVQKSSTESFILSKEMAVLLTCITNTLYLLWKYVKKIDTNDINLKSVFMSVEGEKFIKHLLNNFPYCYSGRSTKTSTMKILEHNGDQRCIHENLLISFLYLMLFINHGQHNVKKEADAITLYLKKVYHYKSSLSEESMHCLLEFLSVCFGEDCHKLQRNGMDITAILTGTITFYRQGKLDQQQKLSLLKILSGIDNNVHLSRNTAYQAWLSTLPDLLCQPSITDSAIVTLLDLSKKNCKAFHSALLKKLPTILENMEKIQIVLKTDFLNQTDEITTRNLASIFSYVPTYTKGDLQLLREFISNTSQSNLKKYLTEVLLLRTDLGLV